MDEKKAALVLSEVKKVLDVDKIVYWLDIGTLLGAARNGRFIPWDDDIDLGIWYSDINKVTNICKRFGKKNFKLSVNYNLITNEYTVISLIKENICISINIYKPEGNNATTKWFTHIHAGYVMAALEDPYEEELIKNTVVSRVVVAFSRIVPKQFKRKILTFLQFLSINMGWYQETKLSVPRHYFDDLSNMEFYNMNFKIPANYKDYLILRYGKNWLIPNKNYIHLKDDGAIQ